jgi:hypothetical protein
MTPVPKAKLRSTPYGALPGNVEMGLQYRPKNGVKRLGSQKPARCTPRTAGPEKSRTRWTAPRSCRFRPPTSQVPCRQPAVCRHVPALCEIVTIGRRRTDERRIKGIRRQGRNGPPRKPTRHHIVPALGATGVMRLEASGNRGASRRYPVTGLLARLRCSTQLLGF